MNEIPKKVLQGKKYIYSGFVLIIFLFLIYGFFSVQIAKTDKYSRISLDNSVRKLSVRPPRGTILDVNNKILVDNRPSFLVSVIPRQFPREKRPLLAEILGMTTEEINELIKNNRSFRPEIIKRDIDYETLTKLEENRLDLPGVIIEPESKRYYPDDVFSPHIFGYVGEVTEMESRGGLSYEPGDMIGKAGLEFTYDANLRGTKGQEYVRVDAEGRELGTFTEESDIPPIPGMDISLALDYSVQQFAESLMTDRRGSIVALDTRNGSVIAFVSKPDYDPRMLSGKIYPEIWNQLMNDESHPLFNRSIQGTYPPGSTYKIVAAIAALQEKIITPKWSVTCPGYFKLGRKTIHCWNADGHGKVDLHAAIKYSCNVYFYQLGLKIGLETWSKYSKMFLFGKKTGIDLPNESSGLVPTFEFFNRVYGKNGWTKGNLANLAIGQGELSTTPLQMAQFAMIIANKGVCHTPHMVDFLVDNDSDTRRNYAVDTKYITGVDYDIYDIIHNAMHAVVSSGTGRRARVHGIEVAGKTGTAQNPHGDSHAWFIGFAPVEKPVIAIAVIIENAGGGGAFAAPMAGLVMEKYFYNRLLPREVPKKDTTKTQADSLPVPFNFQNIQPLPVSVPEPN